MSGGLSTYSEYIAALYVLFNQKILGASNIVRMQGGQIQWKYPTSLYQLFVKYQSLVSYVPLSLISSSYLQFLLLIMCQIFNPDMQYCYDNVFADVSLQGGNPTGIYAVFDVFTWQGWLYTFYFAIAYLLISQMLVSFIVTVSLALFYTFYFGMPFCLSGDITIFGWDVCGSLSFLRTTF